jgi:hypothetical protein
MAHAVAATVPRGPGRAPVRAFEALGTGREAAANAAAWRVLAWIWPVSCCHFTLFSHSDAIGAPTSHPRHGKVPDTFRAWGKRSALVWFPGAALIPELTWVLRIPDPLVSPERLGPTGAIVVGSLL